MPSEAPQFGNGSATAAQKAGVPKLPIVDAVRLKEQDLLSQVGLITILLLLLAVSVTLGKSRNISEPLFPYLLKMGITLPTKVRTCEKGIK